MEDSHVDSARSAKKSSPKNLNRQISAYSFAAAAAGVGMLALAPPAAGEVIITKKTIPIPLAFLGGGVEISLTNDGANDFRFTLLYNFSSVSTNIDGRILIMNKPSHNKGVVGSEQFEPYASALMRGAKIGPTANFVSSVVGFPYGVNIEESNTVTYLHRGSRHLKGNWGGNAKNRFLGVRFLINGRTHYGWIRLTVTIPSDVKEFMTATITGYAYETIPNKAILAGTAESSTAEIPLPTNIPNQGKPSLGMLALGTDGLPLWRR